MNILEQLREAEHFSSAEQNIIRYLLQYPETIINFSVRDLAKASYTSPSTVTRLVKKLDDGHGFSHFKARFFSEINSVFLASGDRTINTNETVHSIVQKIADLEQTAIEQTKQSIDYQTLVRAANLLNSCSQLEFFGFGDNLHLVKPQMYRLLSMGYRVVIHDPNNAQYYQAISTPADAAAILVSHTGNNRRLLDITSILKQRKAKTIILTPANTPLSRIADEWIEIQDSGVNDINGNIVYELSVQFILNVLCGIAYSKNYERNHEILARYLNSYQKFIY